MAATSTRVGLGLPELFMKRCVGLDASLEWPVSRDVLVEVSPDREDLFDGTESIEDLRDCLRLRGDFGSWLYKREHRHNVPVPSKQGASANTIGRRAHARYPSIITSVQNNLAESLTRSNLSTCSRVVQMRSLAHRASAWNPNSNSPGLKSSLSSITLSMRSKWPLVKRPLRPKYRLAHLHNLPVYPRPLGPTHTLLIYTNPPDQDGVYRQMTALPINDLIFLAHCPNLDLPWWRDDDGNGAQPAYRPLPRKRQHELPAVLMRVKDLATFPALVAYMHTRDKLSMFEALLPQWVVDIVRPAFRFHDDYSESRSSMQSHTRKPLDSLVNLVAPLSPQTSEESFAEKPRDPASVATSLACVSTYEELVFFGRTLMALRDNVDDIGLREAALNHDINTLHSIIMDAVKIKSVCVLTTNEF